MSEPYTLHRYATREEWLAARRLGIGGSDVPAILGLSPYKSATPLAVWASKLGLGESDESTYSQRRGLHMESFIAAELAQETEVEVVELMDLAIATHSTIPVLAYSPDALLTDDEGALVLGEWKSQLRGAARWSEEVPEDVVAQVQHGMYVMDLPAAYVAVDLGHEMRWQRVERDPRYESDVVPALLAWWDRHVVRQEPPGPTCEDGPTLARLYPEDHGGSVALPPEMLDDADRLDEIAEQLKALDAERREIQCAVKAALGEATRGVLPDGSGWTWRLTRRVDKPRPEPRVIEYRTLRRTKAR